MSTFTLMLICRLTVNDNFLLRFIGYLRFEVYSGAAGENPGTAESYQGRDGQLEKTAAL